MDAPLVVLSASTDGTLLTWDLASGSALAAYREAAPRLRAVCTLGCGASPAPDYVLSAQAERAGLVAHAWARDAPLLKCALQEPLTSLACASPGGGGLAAPPLVVGGAASGRLYLWDASSGELLRAWQGHFKGVASAAFSRCGAFLATGGLDCAAKCWDVAALADAAGLADAARVPQPLAAWSAHALPVTQVLIAQGGGGGAAPRVVTASLDRCVRVFCVAAGAAAGAGAPPLLVVTLPSAVSAIALCPREQRLFAGCLDGRIYGADLLACAAALAAAQAAEDEALGAAFAALYGDPSRPSAAQAFSGHAAAVTTLCVTPDGLQLVSGGDDAAVRVWDVASRQQVGLFEGHRAPLAAALVLRRPAALAPLPQALNNAAAAALAPAHAHTHARAPAAVAPLHRQHRLSAPPACALMPLRKHAVQVPLAWRGSATGPPGGAGALATGALRVFATTGGAEDARLAEDADACLRQSLAVLVAMAQQQEASAPATSGGGGGGAMAEEGGGAEEAAGEVAALRARVATLEGEAVRWRAVNNDLLGRLQARTA